MQGEREFSEAIGALYDCILDPGQWPAALGKLARYVGGSSALLFHQDHKSLTGNFLQSYNADPDWTRLYFEKYLPLNPVIPLTAFMDVGSSTSLSAVMDMTEYRATPFYAEWAAPQQFLDVVVTVLAKSPTAVGMFGVTRLVDEGLAGPGEVSRMDLVSPHVRRAVSIARMFDGVRQRGSGLASAFDALVDAVWLLDPAGTVLFANAASRALSTARGPVLVAGDRIAFHDASATRRLRDMIRGGASAAAVGELALPGGDGRPFVGHLVSLATSARRLPATAGATWALFVREVVVDEPPPLLAFAQLYGLTPREFQVFTGILQFGSVPDVARNFGLSPTTVRAHLQQVFDKTGVRSQGALMRLAASAMPQVAPPGGGA